MINLQAEYNFDGFRVDHIDHIVDEVSEKEGIPNKLPMHQEKFRAN